MGPDVKVGCRVLAMPTYPLTPDPADVLAVMHADHANLLFTDVHTRGYWPGYAQRQFRERGITLHITDEDRQILTNTVDFVPFSYHMSVCETADPTQRTSTGGTMFGGVPNPTLQASDWGWAIDRPGCGSYATSSGTAGANRCSSSRTGWAPRTSSSRSKVSQRCSTTTASRT